MLTLNFSTPFNMSQNISALLGQEVKSPNAPLYIDGALLGNDDEFFLYGGAWDQTDTSADPIPTQDTVYRGYPYGIDQTAFASGTNTYDLKDLTKYIAYGAAANAPSENLAFYFSGTRTPSWGAIYSISGNDTFVANETSNTLITLDMTTQFEETWTNDTLPDTVTARASPELVWVPVGEQGILVALGGVTYPGYVSGGFTSSNETASVEQSPAFMTTIDVYDVSSKTWYTQETTGGPGTLAQGCAVMQPAQDYSSFNIYWYGGWDGLHPTNASYWDDAVWVLSLPSFTWTQVAASRGSGRGRAGHKCVMPYPDQMMVIGGIPVYPDTGPNCITGDDTLIELFNVSSAQWLDRYDPTVYADYQVPSAVRSAVGGEATGGATRTAPAGGWDNSSLGSIFQVAYATSKLTTYYPYNEASSTAVVLPTVTPTAKHKSSGTPSYLGPVLGVILGLVFLSSLIVGILLWRRRKLLKTNGGVSVVETDARGNRITSWLNGQRTAAKSETITSSEELNGPGSPTPEPARFYGASAYPFTQQYGHNMQHQQQHQELESNALVELPDNSPPAAELSDAPMSPAQITDRSFSARRNDPSLAGWSSIQATDQGSLVSSNSALPFSHRGTPPAPPSSASLSSSANNNNNNNNKTLPNLPELPHSSHASGVSAFSERERAHLRQLSDPATVSTMQEPTYHPILEEGAVLRANSPQPPGTVVIPPRETPSSGVVSPPTAGEHGEAADYLGAKGEAAAEGGDVVSPVAARAEAGRRSAFRESSEDMNEER